jgi:hypothetical protein
MKKKPLVPAAPSQQEYEEAPPAYESMLKSDAPQQKPKKAVSIKSEPRETPVRKENVKKDTPKKIDSNTVDSRKADSKKNSLKKDDPTKKKKTEGALLSVICRLLRLLLVLTPHTNSISSLTLY